jgi:hypothetical protein
LRAMRLLHPSCARPLHPNGVRALSQGATPTGRYSRACRHPVRQLRKCSRQPARRRAARPAPTPGLATHRPPASHFQLLTASCCRASMRRRRRPRALPAASQGRHPKAASPQPLEAAPGRGGARALASAWRARPAPCTPTKMQRKGLPGDTGSPASWTKRCKIAPPSPLNRPRRGPPVHVCGAGGRRHCVEDASFTSAFSVRASPWHTRVNPPKLTHNTHARAHTRVRTRTHTRVYARFYTHGTALNGPCLLVPPSPLFFRDLDAAPAVATHHEATTRPLRSPGPPLQQNHRAAPAPLTPAFLASRQ